MTSPPADSSGDAALEFPPLIDLVPHKPPMLLLDRVLSYSSDVVRCEVEIRTDSPFVEDGQVPAVVGLEYMAQAIAAYAGVTARIEHRDFRMGLLLGSRDLRFAVDGFAVGERLTVEARRTWGENELGSFACAVQRQGSAELLASGTLTVYQGPMPEGGARALGDGAAKDGSMNGSTNGSGSAP
jgi:predicted hotdog family 3-hydroxylacyl-ACP dehydratase